MDGCYTCDGGYLKNTARNTCDFPSKGTYVNAQGSESSCNPITLERGATATWIAGAATTAITCPFSCSPGFVKTGRACNTPDTGKYAGSSGDEQSCEDPTGAAGGFDTFLPNTGAVDSATGCGFSCNAGFMKDSSARQCNYPTKGNYVNNQGAEASCNPITLERGATATWIAGAATTAITCPFSCSPGFVKTGRACNTPDTGKYAGSSGDEQSCEDPTGAAGGFNTFLPNTGAVDSATGCGFSCNAGFMKDSSARQCNYPTKGNYVNNQGAEASCDSITIEGGATATWIAGAAATDATCPYSCSPGFVKTGRACNTPDTGKYAGSSGDEQSCEDPTGAAGGFKEFLSNTGAVSTATGCDFTCNAGFVKKTVGRTCATPDTGKYADAGIEKSCDNPTGAATGFDVFLQNPGAVDSADGCGFSCKSGYVKDASARECNYPSSGNYVTAGNTESPCNSITTEGTAVATRIVGAASTATTCPFSCTAGYVVDTSTPKCKYPTQGTYADAQGAEVSCTDISGITGFGSWLDGAATDADSCPFSCASGYTMLGRICRQPETLALGTVTSHILFSNGEVEAWGKVSNRKWRTHIKENLGGNTPKALVSGYFHQCIILKNGNLNHGRLMCWGGNGHGRLGVGDSQYKRTPTAVTATILGDTGDGSTPNTVKSVSAGEQHTCALLNDDTVKCWGRNNYGQIGGGNPGTKKTISGTTGAPLGIGNARRITAGRNNTCAVLSDKSVQCWGRNNYGQTGGGAPSLGVNKTATEIAMGQVFSCAILNDNTVKCWGGLGQARYIGVGGVPNLGGETATGIALGSWHACALLNDKTVKCWGGNNYGQKGGGTSGSGRVLRGSQTDPLGGQTAIEIAAGFYHSCAIMESDNSVKCWGLNVDLPDTGFYGQIVGEVAMTGGSDGTGTSTGESQTLTASSTPTATSLDSDEDGQICKIELSGGTLGSPWVAKNYTTPLTYNAASGTTVSIAIDNLIAAIGSPVKLATTDVTLTKTGGNKITATVNNAVFEGMTLTIFHDDDGGNCTRSPVGTPITLSGASGAAGAEGLWVISEDYTQGSGDKTVNLDSVHIDLGNSNLTKEEIADKIITKVTDGSWAGEQYKDLPYLATKLDGSSNANDDCPTNDFCVVFNRLFKGAEGNYGIPFGDRDYGGTVSMTGGSDGTGTSTGETATLTAASTPTATALETDASGQICKITLSGGTLGGPWIAKDYTTPLTYNGGGSTAITDAIDNLITAISPPVNIAGTNVTLSKTGTDKIAATTNTAVFEGMTLTIFHDDDGEDCTTSPVATEISLSGASGAADKAEGLWVISNDFISGSGDKTINLDSVSIDLGNTDLSKEDIADKIIGEVTGGSWAGTQYEDLPYTATKVQNSDNSDCPSSDYCVEFTRVFAGSEGNDEIPFRDRDYSH